MNLIFLCYIFPSVMASVIYIYVKYESRFRFVYILFNSLESGKHIVNVENLRIRVGFLVTLLGCLGYFRYVDRLKETLKQMLNLADKMVFLEKEMVVKHKDADVEQSETQPKLELVIRRTKEMQKQVKFVRV